MSSEKLDHFYSQLCCASDFIMAVDNNRLLPLQVLKLDEVLALNTKLTNCRHYFKPFKIKDKMIFPLYYITAVYWTLVAKSN